MVAQLPTARGKADRERAARVSSESERTDDEEEKTLDDIIAAYAT